MNDQVDTDRRPPNPESPIETFRHASSTSTAFNIDSPVFIPNNSIRTASDVSTVESSKRILKVPKFCSASTSCNSCEKFVAPGICNPACVFGPNDRMKDPDVKTLYCQICDIDVCQTCFDSGGHLCHKDILQPE